MQEPSPLAIYSSRAHVCPADVLVGRAPGATVEVERGDDLDAWSSLRFRWPDLEVELHTRPPWDAQFVDHIRGLRDYVLRDDIHYDVPTHRLCERIMRTRRVYSLRETSGRNRDPRMMDVAGALASASYGIVFHDGIIADARGRTLRGLDGERDPEAAIEHPRDALQRRDRSVAALAQRGVSVPETLPPIEGESESLLVDGEAAVGRARALWAVALRAEETMDTGTTTVRITPELRPLLSGREFAYLLNAKPAREASIQFRWRYEALWTVLWYLGHVPELGPQDAICDVRECARVMRSGRLAMGDARTQAEVLDQKDLYFRAHWAAQDARVGGRPPPASIDPGVVHERVHTLFWLTMHHYAAWDSLRVDA